MSQNISSLVEHIFDVSKRDAIFEENGGYFITLLKFMHFYFFVRCYKKAKTEIVFLALHPENLKMKRKAFL